MAFSIFSSVIILVAWPTYCAAESRVGFLGHHADDSGDNMVSIKDLQQTLWTSVDAMLTGGVAAERLASIEASVWRTFQALPKNSLGRLDPRGVRHIVHSYFAKEHGWLINGLEPHGMTANVTEVHDVNILKDKAPALVESLLESRQLNRGLALDDVVAMIGALEQLIFDESVSLLEVAYKLNGYAPGDTLDDSALHEVLRSYLLVFGQGHQADVGNVQKHQDMKEALSWPELDDFQYDIVMNANFAQRNVVNPFKARKYEFMDAAGIVTTMAQDYGKWQNEECSAMKEHLMDLDPDGSGRVPLNIFHTQADSAVYQFTESRDYLRQIGALDESVKSAPRVLIANYVGGPSNCIASSSYYSVCCLNECEILLNEIEGAIQAPISTPERLLSLIGNISSATVSAPRQLAQHLVEKLHGIAEQHGGTVPLQGRLFQQWLHYAFPNECPYPSIVGSSTALTPNQWLGGKSVATAEERQTSGDSKDSTALPDSALAQWSDDEVLPLREPSTSLSFMFPDGASMLRGMLRIAALVGAVYLVAQAASAALETGQSAFSARSSGEEKKKISNHCSASEHVPSMFV